MCIIGRVSVGLIDKVKVVCITVVSPLPCAPAPVIVIVGMADVCFITKSFAEITAALSVDCVTVVDTAVVALLMVCLAVVVGAVDTAVVTLLMVCLTVVVGAVDTAVVGLVMVRLTVVVGAVDTAVVGLVMVRLTVVVRVVDTAVV